MERQEVLQVLHRDFPAAKQRLDAATEKFDAVIREAPTGLSLPEGLQRIHNASGELSIAREEMVEAHVRKSLITDGPFAETKEQLAGYYILDCENLDEAIEWAAKIPTACKGGEGCIEIRPLPGLPADPEMEAIAGHTAPLNG